MKTAFERRSLVVIIVLLIVIFAVVGWNAQRLLSNFSSLEHRAVATDAQRVQKAIQQELNDLGILVGDYAAWDDTYAYVQTHDEKYIANNFTAASLLNLKVDYVLFLDSAKNVVRGMRLRPEDSALVEIPNGDLAVILEHAAYLIPDNQFSARGGYLNLPNGPTAFSARAVVTTAQEGPLRGTLLMGRTIDQATLGSISDDLMFDLHIAADDSAGALALQKDRTQNIAVTELSTREISGTVRVDDPDNSMSFAVEFTRPRNIYANGLATTLLFLGVFVVCAVFSSIIGLLLIKRLALAMKRQQASEEYFSLLAKNSREIMIFTTFPGLKIIEANEAALQASGYSREKITGLHFTDLGKPEIDLQRPDFWERIRKDGKIYKTELRCQDGRLLPVEVNVEAALSDGGQILTFLIRDISDRAEHERMIEGMSQISNSLRTTISIAESVPILLDQVHQMYQADGVALLLWRAKLGRFQLYQATGEWENLNGYDLSPIYNLLHTYFGKINVVTTSVARFFIKNLNINLPVQLNEIGAVRIVNQEQLNGVLVVGRKTPFSQSDELLLEALADLTASTLHRANLFEQTREYARQIEAVEEVGRTLAETLELDEIHPRLVEALLSTFDGLESVAIWQRDPQSGAIERVIGMRYEGSPLPPPPGGVIPGEILAAMETQKTHLMGGPLGERPEKGTGQVEGATLILPALRNEGVMAVLEIHSLEPTTFTAEKIDLIALVGSSAAIAYENALLYAEVEKRLSQIQSLREIDTAIVSSLNQGDVLSVLLEQFRKQLKVDAAIVWMPSSKGNLFLAAQASGLPPLPAEAFQLDADASLAGRSLEDHRVLAVTGDLQEAAWMKQCAFQSGYAAAMVAQGKPLGVVEVFHRDEIKPDVDWFRMFETLARQGAVALSTLGMFKDLQRKNRDLVEAYNATIEGWAKALDMRDHETRGHSLRVTETTVNLARFMGVPEEELEHLRRGALLHDIGKMGIPDSILLKAGSLDEKEWETMRLHPVLSAEFLKNIRFLESALDIPLNHHEWWDGTGYPRGLKGEEIPLSARIFAVVDVWDALNSDRPYRLAWPEQTVLPYILTQSGTHFDPNVVDQFTVFLKTYAHPRDTEMFSLSGALVNVDLNSFD